MSKVMPIAVMTFRESLRSKILYSVFFFAAVVVGISALFGTVTIGDQVKIVKDFGLFSVSIFSVAYSVIAGSTLLDKELTRKTIFNLLSRPVRRWQFVLGKYLGLLYTACVLLCLMAFGLSAFAYCFEHTIDPLMFEAYYFSLLELAVVCSAALFFSSLVVTPSLSGMFTFALFLAGRSTEYILYFVKNADVQGPSARVLEAIYWVLPHLDQLNVSNIVVYGDPVGGELAVWGTIYAVAYSAVMLSLASFFFGLREFN